MKAKKKNTGQKRRGRPKLDQNERLAARLELRLTQAEKAAIEETALKREMNASELIRSIVMGHIGTES